MGTAGRIVLRVRHGISDSPDCAKGGNSYVRPLRTSLRSAVLLSAHPGNDRTNGHGGALLRCRLHPTSDSSSFLPTFLLRRRTGIPEWLPIFTRRATNRQYRLAARCIANSHHLDVIHLPTPIHPWVRGWGASLPPWSSAIIDDALQQNADLHIPEPEPRD